MHMFNAGKPVMKSFDHARSFPFEVQKFDRRDTYEYFYIPVDCPELRKCNDGRCPLAHSKLEKIFHPMVYKSQACQMAKNKTCEYLHKCAFYHDANDKGVAEMLWQHWEAHWKGWRSRVDEILLAHKKADKEIRHKVEGILKIRKSKAILSNDSMGLNKMTSFTGIQEVMPPSSNAVNMVPLLTKKMPVLAGLGSFSSSTRISESENASYISNLSVPSEDHLISSKDDINTLTQFLLDSLSAEEQNSNGNSSFADAHTCATPLWKNSLPIKKDMHYNGYPNIPFRQLSDERWNSVANEARGTVQNCDRADMRFTPSAINCAGVAESVSTFLAEATSNLSSDNAQFRHIDADSFHVFPVNPNDEDADKMVAEGLFGNDCPPRYLELQWLDGLQPSRTPKLRRNEECEEASENEVNSTLSYQASKLINDTLKKGNSEAFDHVRLPARELIHRCLTKRELSSGEGLGNFLLCLQNSSLVGGETVMCTSPSAGNGCDKCSKYMQDIEHLQLQLRYATEEISRLWLTNSTESQARRKRDSQDNNSDFLKGACSQTSPEDISQAEASFKRNFFSCDPFASHLMELPVSGSIGNSFRDWAEISSLLKGRFCGNDLQRDA